ASLLLLALSGLSVGQPVAWGQHSWRSGLSNWGGLNLVGPGGQFTMYQGPVGGWPMFAPQPLPWGFPAGPVVYAPGYSAWGPGVIVAGPMGWSTAPAWPVGPLAVDPRDLGFGHHPPELPPLAPAPQVDRLRRLPLAEDLAKRAVPALPAGPAGAGVQPVAPGAIPPQDEQAQPPQDNPPLFLKASNAEQRRRSLRAQAQGDEQFRKLQFLPAVGRYRQAAEAAADLPEPRLRLAWALVALGEFGQGVEHLQRGLRLDPDWAAHGPGLRELLGPGQQLAAETILHRVAGWVRADIRDPDRLLLLGVLLHFREDAAQAREVLTTAAALGGEASTARQFLGSLDRLVQRSAPRPPEEANVGTVLPDPRAPSRPGTPPPGGRASSPAAGPRETPAAPSATPALPATPLDPAPVPNPPEAESPAAQLEQSRTTSRSRGVAPAPARAPGAVRPQLSPPA
ncbi:MAG: hypothetical protein ACKOGA_01285, partial [Planctomycetaceae bacterium]